MKRDFDCDTCSWFEDGRCTNFNRSAYYPCPEWLRRFDPEKYICDQEWIDTVELEAVLTHVKRTYPLNGNGCPASGTILYDQIAKPRGGGIRVPTKARAWEEEGDSKCQAR